MKYRKLHSWKVSPKKAIEIQKNLRNRLILRKHFGKITVIAGADVAFSKKEDKAFGAVVVLSYPELKVLEEAISCVSLKFPYVPGLLTFREAGSLLKCFEKIKHKPDVIIFDGQGIAHQRGMGLASHMGLILNKPTIGCAKSRLIGRCKQPPKKKGAYTLLKSKKGDSIGACLRTRDGVKPVFVSPGHRVDLESSIKIVKECATKYRIPEPTRLADQLAARQKKRFMVK